MILIKEVRFIGGCNGNTQGVAALAKGRNIDEVINTIKGIDCGGRGTSCPDQLALALIAYKRTAGIIYIYYKDVHTLTSGGF